jgi:hypothetical protein
MSAPEISINKLFNSLPNAPLSTQKRLFSQLLEDEFDLSLLSTSHLKTLISLCSHRLDIVRELAISTLTKSIGFTDEIEECLEHILQMLVERTNSFDLEDVQNIPEPMRPLPSQKPSVLHNLVERTEEVREYFCLILKDLLDTLDEEFVYENLNTIINILRALTMDPCPSIRSEACKVWVSFLSSYRESLENFTGIICRALLLPLTSKKSPVQISALKAIKELLYIGPFKHSVRLFSLKINP